jgi:hypothetical protein
MTDDIEKRPVGRPTLYRDDMPVIVEKLCRLGADDIEIADFFEVHVSSIYQWKLDYPVFSEAIKKGKMQSDAEVADRLYSRAMGYFHEDVHITAYEGEVTLTPITKYYPPDTTAAIFWLKNRQKAKWRDDKNLNLGGQDGENPIKTESEITITPEEAYKRLLHGK